MKKRVIGPVLVMLFGIVTSAAATEATMDQDGYAVLNSSKQVSPIPDPETDNLRTGPR